MAAHSELSGGGAPRPIGRTKAAGLLLAAVASVAASFLIAAPAGAADDKNYGKPGDPIDLAVGYQPYYTESWSGLIMRGKQFYEKYLPKGSTVNFQVGLQGAIIVNQMIAGKQDIGYAGDMPVDRGYQQIGYPRSASRLDAWAWLRPVQYLSGPQRRAGFQVARRGHQMAFGQNGCGSTRKLRRPVCPGGLQADRYPADQYLNQNIELITSGFRADKIDAAVVWEPTASHLVLDGLARKVATGASVNELDGGYMIMPQALITQRPDVVKAWLQAELDAELYFGDSKNAMDIASMALAQTTGFPEKALWASAFGINPKSSGGTDTRLTLSYGFTPDAMEHIQESSKFLLEIKSISADIRPDAVVPQFTDEILKARGLTAPVGVVKALPDSAYTGPMKGFMRNSECVR